MTAEVVIVSAYALGLLLLALVIRRVGEASQHAWSSRMFAAYRAEYPVPPVGGPAEDWPHSEAPQLYRTIATVAVAAGLVLCLMEMAHHHRPAELALETAVGIVLAGVLSRWLRGLLTTSKP